MASCSASSVNDKGALHNADRFVRWHKDCKVTNDSKTVGNHYQWTYTRSCYGALKIASNGNDIVTWTIKMEKNVGYVAVGIATSPQTDTWFNGQKDPNLPNYAYDATGQMWENGKKVTKRDPFTGKDLISITLDIPRGEVRFYRNQREENAPQKVFKINKKKGLHYRLAVAIKDSTVTLKKFECESQKSNSKQIFCFYPVDILLAPDNATSIHLRSTPFDTHTLSSSNSNKMASLLEHDESNNIYYLPLGTSPSSISLRTPDWKWPDRYTMLIWIRWSGIHGLLTTFDSDSNSPIFISQCRLGCAGKSKSGNSKWDVLRYKVAEDEWQCVIAEGGGSQTVFRVGDLQTVPTLKGVVSCDVAGQITHRLGNRGQGPGDVGCVMVFDRALSDQEIEEIYKESKAVMKGTQSMQHQKWKELQIENMRLKQLIIEMTEMKENEIKSVGDCAEWISGEMKQFQDRYNKQSVQQMVDENPMNLVDDQSTLNMDITSITEDIRRVQDQCKAFDKYLDEIKGVIEALGDPDTAEYENWNIGTIIIWISGLEDGRYRRYLEQIRNGFVTSEIVRGEYLPDLNEAILSIEPFNISSFPDKRDLVRHFKALSANHTNTIAAAAPAPEDMQEGANMVEYIDR